MKKVIFVGGTAFSGSTFFGMTLGNDPRGFSCGEVRNFLNPTRPHHMTLPCGCGQKDCKIWEQIKNKGQERLYDTIFERFPEVDFIVDSSKSPFWIRSQRERLFKKGIQTKSILIWKTPLELAHSYQKRGHLQAWERSWVNYHRLFYTLVSDWRAVNYQQYTNNGTVLRKACRYLEIPYFLGKERFWEKAHHVLGGNHSARVHLYSANSEGYRRAKSKVLQEATKYVKATHRSIYYRQVVDESLARSVEQKIGDSKHIAGILELLSAYDVANEIVTQHEWQMLEMPGPVVWARKIRQTIQLQAGRIRYARGG